MHAASRAPSAPSAQAQAHAPVLGGRRKGRTTDRDGPRKVRPSKRHDVSNLPRSGESLHPAHPQLSPLACPRAAPTPTIRQEGLPDVVPLADRTARAHAHAPPSLSRGRSSLEHLSAPPCCFASPAACQHLGSGRTRPGPISHPNSEPS